MNEIYVGFVPIARTTFDMGLAQEVSEQARQSLQQAGLTLVGPPALVASMEDVQAAIDELVSDPPDLLILFQATFADSTLAMQLATEIDAPLLLWGVPEAFTGGRLRLNSLTGINLAAHALRRRNYAYEHVYGAPDEAEVIEKIVAVAKAGRVCNLLAGARIGRVGEPPSGFETCLVDAEEVADRFGVEIVQMDLRDEVFAPARQISANDIQAERQQVAALVDGLDALDGKATDGTLSVYRTLRQIAQKENLDGYAVRCWPEFFTEMGCAACGAMSLLGDQYITTACEADTNGTLTQLMLQWLSGEPSFGADVVGVENEHDSLVLWHCGLAPLSMADPDVRPQGTIHSNRKLPLLMEFPLKPGRVTVARLSEATGEYRLVIGSGDMLRVPKRFSGTSGVLRFARPATAVLDTILSEGLEHHVCLTYGDHTAALAALGKMLDLPVLWL